MKNVCENLNKEAGDTLLFFSRLTSLKHVIRSYFGREIEFFIFFKGDGKK